MNMNVKGKTIVVTGASQGIGRAIALKLAEAGENIAFTYLTAALVDVHQLEQELLQWGGQIKGFCVDVSDWLATKAVIENVIQEFGSIDVLVNNAGITRDKLLLRMSEEDWNNVLNANMKGVFNTTKASIGKFIKQRSGSIINIAYVVGISGNAGQANYAASKAGIIGDMMINDIMQERWKEKNALKRIGEPGDVANCALFLASNASSYITLQVIQVDGGLVN